MNIRTHTPSYIYVQVPHVYCVYTSIASCIEKNVAAAAATASTQQQQQNHYPALVVAITTHPPHSIAHAYRSLPPTTLPLLAPTLAHSHTRTTKQGQKYITHTYIQTTRSTHIKPKPSHQQEAQQKEKKTEKKFPNKN